MLTCAESVICLKQNKVMNRLINATETMTSKQYAACRNSDTGWLKTTVELFVSDMLSPRDVQSFLQEPRESSVKAFRLKGSELLADFARRGAITFGDGEVTLRIVP